MREHPDPDYDIELGTYSEGVAANTRSEDLHPSVHETYGGLEFSYKDGEMIMHMPFTRPGKANEQGNLRISGLPEDLGPKDAIEYVNDTLYNRLDNEDIDSKLFEDEIPSNIRSKYAAPFILGLVGSENERDVSIGDDIADDAMHIDQALTEGQSVEFNVSSDPLAGAYLKDLLHVLSGPMGNEIESVAIGDTDEDYDISLNSGILMDPDEEVKPVGETAEHFSEYSLEDDEVEDNENDEDGDGSSFLGGLLG